MIHACQSLTWSPCAKSEVPKIQEIHSGYNVYDLLAARGSRFHPLRAQTRDQALKVQSGMLTGVHLGADANAAAFLGIPYAAPPVGGLRWKPPRALQSWRGTHDATQFGWPSPQLPALWFHHIEGHEDCLYTERLDFRISAQMRIVPVLVYFHGGSNTQGYSQMTPLGPPLSALGLVVVSTNCRTQSVQISRIPRPHSRIQASLFRKLRPSGPLQALEWVKENIREFGGDPKRVTVMGQSAGTVNICLLMASPLSQGLFHRAILESGECQDTLGEASVRRSVQLHRHHWRALGRANWQRISGVSSGPDLLQKLRDVPASQILEYGEPILHSALMPIVDGWVVPRQPAQIFAEGKPMHIPQIADSQQQQGHRLWAQ